MKSEWVWWILAGFVAFWLYEKAQAQAAQNRAVNMGENLAQTIIDDVF